MGGWLVKQGPFSTLACFFLRIFLRELVSCEKYLDDLVAGIVVKFTVHIP